MTCEVGLGRIQPSRADDDRHGRKAHVCYPRQYQQRRSEMAWFARSLTVLAILVGFLCLPLRATSAQQSAPVTDCSHAKTAVDRALCTTPELRAADARMAHAYLALKAGLARAQQSVLLADQRRWIGERDGRCADKSARDLIACLRAQTDQRRRFFAGEGPNLAVDAPLLRPVFFGESRKGHY